MNNELNLPQKVESNCKEELRYQQKFPQQISTWDTTFLISGLIEIQPKSCKRYGQKLVYNPREFEFVQRSGHTFKVPECVPGFQLNEDVL